MAPGWSIRKPVGVNETLHPKQRMIVRGKLFKRSYVSSDQGVTLAVGQGYEDVLVGGRWTPITEFVPRTAGGDRSSNSSRRRRCTKKPAHSGRAVLPSERIALATMPAFLISLPKDTDLRTRCRSKLIEMSFQAVFIPQAVVGKDLVAKAERTSVRTTTLNLNRKGQLLVNRSCVCMKAPLHKALGVLGCVLSHRQIWQHRDLASFSSMLTYLI